MSDLHPGVTRYPAALGTVTGRVSRELWVPAVLAFAAGATGAFFTGGPVVTGLGHLSAGVLVPPLTVVLPWRLRLLVLVALVAWLLATADWHSDTGLAYVGCFAGSFPLGLVLLRRLLKRRRWRSRMASGTGAPASGLDPTGGARVGVLVAWRAKEFDYEAVDPGLAVVSEAVRSLDGVHRSVVSIYRGRARMDVGGDARGPMVVQASDNRRRWGRGSQVADPLWRTPGSAAEWDELRTRWVTFAGERLEFPEQLLTTLEPAQTAVAAWLATGARAPSLTWWRPPRLLVLRRPKALQEQDKPWSTIETVNSTVNLG